MAQCQIQPAALYALPRGPTPVEDRRISLDTNCHEPGSYGTKLLGMTPGKTRKGAPVREFVLCENHSQLIVMVDRELGEEGWAAALTEPPRFLA